MKFEYNSIREESSIILTDFNCNPAQKLLKDKGYYKIIWARDADCSISIDGYDISLEQHQVMFCTPLNVIEVNKESGIIAIVFNREFYCIRDHDHEVSCNGILFLGSSQPPVITLCEKDIRSFEAMFVLFKEEFETRDHVQGEMLRVILKRLLIKSTRLIKEMRTVNDLPSNVLDTIRRFHLYVEQYFKEKHKVSDYAELLHKSPKTLSNMFKKAKYPTPLSIINDRIIIEAKRLLLFSNKTAEEIAYELGYNEGAHFSKFFKSHTQIPPVSFREQKLKH